jgi:hypothetical protein
VPLCRGHPLVILFRPFLRTGHLNEFEFVTRWAMRPLDPLGELRMLMPVIARFSRYGTR